MAEDVRNTIPEQEHVVYDDVVKPGGTKIAEVLMFTGRGLSDGKFTMKIVSCLKHVDKESGDVEYVDLPQNERTVVLNEAQTKQMLLDSFTIKDENGVERICSGVEVMKSLKQLSLAVWHGEYDIKTPPITDPLVEEEDE